MTQIHEMKMEGDVMKMAEAARRPRIPAGEHRDARAGRASTSCSWTSTQALVEGTTVPVTLTFEKAGTVDDRARRSARSTPKASETCRRHRLMADTRSMRTFRIVLWTLVVVAAIGATALFVLAPPRARSTGRAAARLRWSTSAAIRSTRRCFVGHPSLLFFGYTHCPDVCPTTMGEMPGWFATLGDEAKDLQRRLCHHRSRARHARDPRRLCELRLRPASTGVTGPQAEIDKIVKDWNVTAEKVPGDGDDYTMNHTASVFLVNRRASSSGPSPMARTTDTALDKIRRLVANS